MDHIERFFEIWGVQEEEWVLVAMVAMEGKALTWYRWWEETVPLRTWESFKEAVVRRFQPELVQNPFKILVGIKQEGSVQEFWEQFEMYSQPLKISERRYLLGLFLNGLKDEVRAELKLHSFHTLEQLMNLAEMVESRNNLLLKSTVRGVGKVMGYQGSTRFGGAPHRSNVGGSNAGGSGAIREDLKQVSQGLRGKGY